MRFSASSVRSLTTAKRRAFLTSLTAEEAAALTYHWPFWARRNQLPPKGNWRHWLILAGRGFGKTRTGAEWVRRQVEAGGARHIALIAPTLHDARAVMVEGESGLLAISPPWARPRFEPSKRTLRWPNGAVATLFSAEEPERLRGPQHDCAWADELCAWRQADATWDMLMFGLRLGLSPRAAITTTPKPVPVLKKLMADAHVHVTRGSTYENLDNLAPAFAADIVRAYEGTRLGRQELMAEILEDVPGALWTRGRIERLRVPAPPELVRLVVAVDPPAGAGEGADECGLVAVGLAHNGRAYVVADDSTRGLTPHGWAARVVALYHRLKADRIVAETNQGGAMVAALIAQIDPSVPVRAVHATRSKVVRAEPVAALYEQGRVHHAGAFPALEDQMCAFTPEGLAAGSPDRVDALVWAITELMLKPKSQPTIRML